MTNFVKSYYRGGHRVMMGGVPVRVARLPSGPAGKAMMAESSRDMCIPGPPRNRKDFGQWEKHQLEAYKAATKLGDRSIADVITMPARASSKPAQSVSASPAITMAPEAPKRPTAATAPLRVPSRPVTYRRANAISAAHMRTINYYRVSTEKQGRSGLGLDAQRSAVEAFCAARGCETIGEYVEIESGKRDDRPELAKALAQCRLTGATLIIAKLDRLSRNVAFLAALQDSGARFLCADMPDMSELTLHIVAAMAQNERKMISARTKAALAQAKARGVTLGNPLGAKAFGDKISEGRAASRAAREARAQAFAQEVRPIIDDIRSAGPLSLSQIAAELDRRNILPPQGGRWNKATLSRVIARTD